MARLVRLQQATEARAAAAALAAQIAAEDARRLATELDAAMTELVQLRTQREAVETNTRQAAELWSQIDALRATRRYRLAGAIGGFVDALEMRRDPA
jgi:succinate dehydrogenase/fumarate reductase flavoprotein subunit